MGMKQGWPAGSMDDPDLKSRDHKEIKTLRLVKGSMSGIVRC